MLIEQIYESGVLVIGGGGAGLRAALEARERGADVLVVSKGIAGRSGVTVTALTGYQAAFGHADPADSPQVHYEDTLRNGQYLSDPVLARILAEESPLSVLDLEKRGVRFEKTPDGRFVQKRLDSSQSYPRSVRIGDSLGMPIMNVLRKECKRTGVRHKNDTLITQLLQLDGRVCGAAGFDLASGQPVLFRANTVILAAGGAAGLYAVSSTPPMTTGDGYMLAYRAGARLVDMEFMLFLGHALVWPPSARGVLFPFQYLFPHGARPLYNSEGTEFVSAYAPDGSANPSRDVYARAIHWEVRAGRGTPHGGAWFDPSSVSRDVLERELPSQVKFIESMGADLTKPVEVGVAGHYMCGGVCIDEYCRTGIPGLYAAGEVAGGVHGGARIGGNALAELFVFGRRAGQAAAEEARSATLRHASSMEKDALREDENRRKRLLQNTGGPSADTLWHALQRTMWQNVSVVRNGTELKEAAAGFRRLREQIPSLSLSCACGRYNLEWIRAAALENMAELAEIMALAALNREESRAGHYREDFPAMDPAWHCNQFAVRSGDGPSFIRKKSLAAMPSQSTDAERRKA